MFRQFLNKKSLFTCIVFLTLPLYATDTDLSSSYLRKLKQPRKKKKWTFIAYIAADNDLRSFAARNIKQMAEIGSNSNINIVAHLDIRMSGNKKVTRRYYIEKKKILHVNVNDPATQKMDSGHPNTLISCCEWAMTDYPADNYALVFWNHGTGIIDPVRGQFINPTELFTFNPNNNRLELNRTIGFLDFVELQEEQERGICWDDSTGNYLTNQDMDNALGTIRKSYMKGEKFALICFDACLMSMLEVANIIKRHAHIMISSQEVELGTGWNYKKALSQFSKSSPTKEELAKNIVTAYGSTYQHITYDYTQSAINLDKLGALEENVHQVAQILNECLKIQKNSKVKTGIRASRNKMLCTHFDEPSYIDLHHFYRNLQANLKIFAFKNVSQGNKLTKELRTALEEGRKLIESAVLANTVGRNLRNARGISIYFPERRIHSSYRKTTFAAKNAWLKFLDQYLLLR